MKIGNSSIHMFQMLLHSIRHTIHDTYVVSEAHTVLYASEFRVDSLTLCVASNQRDADTKFTGFIISKPSKVFSVGSYDPNGFRF